MEWTEGLVRACVMGWRLGRCQEAWRMPDGNPGVHVNNPWTLLPSGDDCSSCTINKTHTNKFLMTVQPAEGKQHWICTAPSAKEHRRTAYSFGIVSVCNNSSSEQKTQPTIWLPSLLLVQHIWKGIWCDILFILTMLITMKFSEVTPH